MQVVFTSMADAAESSLTVWSARRPTLNVKNHSDSNVIVIPDSDDFLVIFRENQSLDSDREADGRKSEVRRVYKRGDLPANVAHHE